MPDPVIAVVIPCYRVRRHILGVIAAIGPECGRIYVVDDKCPEESGAFVRENCADPRVRILFHEVNQGVGGAVTTGYRTAADDGADVIVKIDGDGQMDPALLPRFAAPILDGRADYTKGNRFYNIEDVRSMPKARLIGNAGLSFLTKLSSGYWTVFDPTNGYTAIHAKIVRELPLAKIGKRYFFESDMLFRLNTLRACVIDIPMKAVYADEESNLVIRKIIGEFFLGNMRNFAKRVFYNYFLRDFSIASAELVIGAFLFLFGVLFGTVAWIGSATSGVPASTGTVMVAALPIILGLQLLLSFAAYDMGSVPKTAIHPLLPNPSGGANDEAVRA